MTFDGCPHCDGRGWVSVYSKKIIDAVRRGEAWKYTRSVAMCSCVDGRAHAEKFTKGPTTLHPYEPGGFCRDVSHTWDWPLNAPNPREQRRADHEAHIREWLAGRGTELIGTFSMDEWGVNHGG